jgi:hypothetical protein
MNLKHISTDLKVNGIPLSKIVILLRKNKNKENNKPYPNYFDYNKYEDDSLGISLNESWYEQ